MSKFSPSNNSPATGFKRKVRSTATALAVASFLVTLTAPTEAQFRSSYATATTSAPHSGTGHAPGHPAAVKHAQPTRQSSQAQGVYPQFRSSFGTIRWLREQMPLKVYISPGQTLDSIIDPQLGAPYTSVDNRDHWPDLVASVVQDPQQLQSLPVAPGYVAQHGQAALQGINSWKAFEQEGLFSFVITDNPAEADIYVFWTNHFVNKLGMGLFQNDIRGYTAKRSFPYAAIQAGKQADFKPVVCLLRTTDSANNPMSADRMRASAAHEFGHALGIEGHSSNPNDLMSIYYGHGVISNGDAATIRYLYHLTPDLIP